MTNLAVHQNLYMDQQQPQQLPIPPPGMSRQCMQQKCGYFCCIPSYCLTVHACFVDPPLTPAKGKKRGRPLKSEIKEQAQAEDSPKKAKRTLDRFNGMSVEEVMAKKLPDIITHNLEMLIVSFCL